MKKTFRHIMSVGRACFLFLCLCITASGCGQICGCTDPLATNYDAKANSNDGSCKYAPAKIKTTAAGELDTLLNGTSSLFYWENGYWTYNDHFDRCLYRLDSSNATTLETLCVNGVRNRDTEEIAQDDHYLYFGDVGNNNGQRRNLHILKISKKSLLDNTFKIDTIRFSYEDQTDFTATSRTTDFDCEAFVVTDDSIYLFTKQWTSLQTTVYSLPKTPGTHIAHRRESYNVKGLITGATYVPEYQLIVLCGYDYDKNHILSSLHPFLILLYDFKDDHFFSGNKRRLDFNSSVKSQIEAVATHNGLDYYLTCEHFKTTVMGFTFDLPAQLLQLDLRDYLLPYLNGKKQKNVK